MTAFLLYDPAIVTPPDIVYGQAYTIKGIGESGRYWEYLTFGGYIDMRGERWNNCEIVVSVREKYNKYAWKMRSKVVRELVEHRSKYGI